MCFVSLDINSSSLPLPVERTMSAPFTTSKATYNLAKRRPCPLSSVVEHHSLQLPFIGPTVRSAKLFYSHLVAYQASSSHPAFTGKTTFRPLFYQFRGSPTIKLGRRHHWAIWLRGERLLVGKYDKRQKAARNAQPRSRQRSASPNLTDEWRSKYSRRYSEQQCSRRGAPGLMD